MKNAVILPYYKAFQQDLEQIYPKNQIFILARTHLAAVFVLQFKSAEHISSVGEGSPSRGLLELIVKI